MEFQPMPKMPRLSREVVITEKIDGTNASVFIWDPLEPREEPIGWPEGRSPKEPVQKVNELFIIAGSRTRWITPEDDNYGFAAWVRDNADQLVKLGPGHHFGEWWGRGINRGYGLSERRFSLFNVGRWTQEAAPACCHVVPVLYRGGFDMAAVNEALETLQTDGSVAAPSFMNPEGVVVYHTAANQCFKKTIKGDDGKYQEPKKEHPPKPPRDPNAGGRRKGCEGYPGPFRRRTDVARTA
jgi:hypothetical protein